MDPSNQSSLPAFSGRSIHVLPAAEKKNWWQIGCKKKIPSPYKNEGIQQSIVTLTVLPVFCFMALSKYPHMNVVPSILLWLSVFAFLTYFVRRHARHVHQVEQSEEGLVLKSPFLNDKVRWLEIKNLIPVSGEGIGDSEMLLECQNGEQYFLSKNLSDAEALFSVIQKRTASAVEKFNVAFRLSDGFVDIGTLASFAVCFPVLYPALMGNLPLTPSNILIIVGSVLLSAFFVWIHQTKLATLVCLNDTGLYACTRSGRTRLTWERVKKIKKFGTMLVVGSTDTWFLVFANTKEPVKTLLLERQQKLLSGPVA